MMAKMMDGMEMHELLDEQLEAVVGGLTKGDKEMLDRYIKTCKYNGLKVTDAVAELQKRFPKDNQVNLLNDMIDYVHENW